MFEGLDLFSIFAERLGPLLSVFAASFLQSVTGFGLMMTASPLLMQFYDPKFAVLVLIYLGITANFAQVVFIWRTAKFGIIKYLLAGAACGMPLGYGLYSIFSSNALRMFVSIFLLVFLTFTQIAKLKIEQRPRNSFIAGLFSGMTSTSVSMAGPPLVLYFASSTMDKHELRSTTVTYFGITQALSFLIFLLGGHNMVAAGKEFSFLIPGLACGLFVGQLVFKHISTKVFRYLLFAMIYYICLQSLYNSLIKYF